MELIRNFESVKEDLSKEEQYNLPFIPRLKDEQRFKLLNRGWWYIPAFAVIGSTTYGWRLMPGKAKNDWPVMHTRGESKCNTFAPNIDLFPAFTFLSVLADKKMFDWVRKDYGIMRTAVERFTGFLNVGEGMDFLDKYVRDDSNIPSSAPNTIDDSTAEKSNYIQYWSVFGGEAYENLFQLLSTLFNDSSYLPQKPADMSFGIWQTRANHLIGQRAKSVALKRGYDQVERLIWKSFEDSHGFDTENGYFKILPNLVNQGQDNISGITGFLSSKASTYSEVISNSPLRSALAEMGQGTFKYWGDKHIEAAAEFDVNENNPRKAWDCLINAGYWSGLNYKKAMHVPWQAAIMLSEKHGWTDIHEALVWQWEWYHDYKKKNKID